MAYPSAEYILNAVEASLRLANGTAPYENDLSGSGVVAIAEQFTGAAQVIVFLPDVARAPAIRTLQRTDRTASIYVQGRVGAAADYETRLRASLRLANDCARAIEVNILAQADVALSGLANRITSRELTVSQQSGLPEQGLGSFVIVFTVTYRVDNFTGF